VLALLAVALPARATAPVLPAGDGTGELAAVRATCRAAGPGAALVLTDGASVSAYLQTLRSFCGLPALGVLEPTRTTLAAVHAALAQAGRRPVVVTFRPGSADLPADQPATVDLTVRRWRTPLLGPPDGFVHERREVWVAVVEADGRLAPVPG
jgi:hypothetical protein